jgi:hypothetical protein
LNNQPQPIQEVVVPQQQSSAVPDNGANGADINELNAQINQLSAENNLSKQLQAKLVEERNDLRNQVFMVESNKSLLLEK